MAYWNGFEITNEKPNSLSIKNPYGDDDSRPIRLTGAIYEQDYRVRAEGTSLSSKLHQDTEKSLEEEGMKPIFKDTKTILLKRLSIISESIEQGAASLKEQDNQATEEITTQILENKAYLKRQQSEATAEISEQIKTYKEQLLKSIRRH